MSFIGIIGNKNDYTFIKKAISKSSLKNQKVEIIDINNQSIENVKNIKFETLIISQNLDKLKEQQKYIEQIIKNVKYLIINTDIKTDMNILGKIKCNIITYGLNQKATITISSVGEENILVCIQRNLEDIEGNIIEEQEYNIKSKDINNRKIYNLLATYIIYIIYKADNFMLQSTV